MRFSWNLFFFFFFTASYCLLNPSTAQTCKSHIFNNGKTFHSCSDLPVLDSYIHFSYVPEGNVLELAYRHSNIQSSNWVSWAINPSSHGMLGAQSIVAYQNPKTGLMKAHTSPITSYDTTLEEGPLSFNANQITAEYANNEITIFATLTLPNNKTMVNHLWQDGPIREGRLGTHPTGGDNVKSMGTLDLLSGQTTSSPEGNEYMVRVKTIHGIMNTMSWGFLIPLGAMAARYMRTYNRFDPLWFHIHIICQTVGYLIGCFGGLITAILMWRSRGIRAKPHAIVGIFVFVLGFLQLLAFKARPNKEHRYRRYWNWYHHVVGYVVIGLSIYNIYGGLDLLQPAKEWRIVYTVAIALLGVGAAVMEILRFKKLWGWGRRSLAH